MRINQPNSQELNCLNSVHAFALVIAVLIVILVFLIEMLITRNYGLAVIFITPLTVIFANTGMQLIDVVSLILSRLLDISIGGVIGLLGGWFIYRVQFLDSLQKYLKK